MCNHFGGCGGGGGLVDPNLGGRQVGRSSAGLPGAGEQGALLLHIVLAWMQPAVSGSLDGVTVATHVGGMVEVTAGGLF